MKAAKAMEIVASVPPDSLVHVFSPRGVYSTRADNVKLDPSRSYSVRPMDAPGYSLRIKARGRWSDLPDERRKEYRDAMFFWGRVLLVGAMLYALYKMGIHAKQE